MATQIEYVIHKFRKAVFLRQDPSEIFREYYQLTGRMDHYDLIPYLPKDTLNSVNKLRENIRVMLAVQACRKSLSGVVAPKVPDCVRKPQNRHGVDTEWGNMNVDRDDLPMAKLTADYSAVENHCLRGR